MIMRYLYSFFIVATVVLVPFSASAQANLSISGAVKIEETNTGQVRFSYAIEQDSTLTLRTECIAEAKFFIEETGAIVSCGDTYEIENAGEGGRLEIIPYEVGKAGTATHILVQTRSDGTEEEFARKEVELDIRTPRPIFSAVSVRQEDPTKPNVVVSWETLAKANVSLYLACDSDMLEVRDETGNSYACNEKIALWHNEDTNEETFTATGFSTSEGLLFMFSAEQDDVIGARKNISFTFETTTDGSGSSEDESGVIARLISQVKALLQVVASLFK